MLTERDLIGDHETGGSSVSISSLTFGVPVSMNLAAHVNDELTVKQHVDILVDTSNGMEFTDTIHFYDSITFIGVSI